MSNELSPQDIKDIRNSYGLSQKDFARVLGIGEASIVRYENGVTPTRANANLIRAARMPEFMLDCLERDGYRIPEERYTSAKQIVYAEMQFDEEGEVVSMNEIYELTLSMEILNEQAAEILGELHRLRREATEAGNTSLADVYDDAVTHLILAKHSILDADNQIELAETRGKIKAIGGLVKDCYRKIA